MKRLAIGVLALLLAAGLCALIVHTPPVRRAVLRYVIAEVQRRFGIRVDAARLDYNLAELSVGLAQVRMAADGLPDAPFFSADYVRASLPRRALTGVVAFEDVAVTGGHVRVVRDRDGHTNLPESSETAAGEPAALDIAHLSAPGLVIDLQDGQNDLTLAVPGLNIDIGRSSGRVSLVDSATLAMGSTRSRMSMLAGGVAFDGRALTLSAVQVRTDEASARLDGRLSLLVRESSLDVHATGEADVGKLARWSVASGELPRGAIAFDIHAMGAMATPAADVKLTSARLSWQRLAATDVAATSHLTAGAADLQDARFTIAGGRVTATGRIPFADTPAHLAASWRDVDAGALTDAVAGAVAIAPTGSLSGSLDLTGPLAQFSRWSADARLHADGGVTRRGRLAVPGDTRLQLADGRWQIEAHHRAGAAIPIVLVAGGQLDAERPANSMIAGRVDVADINVAPLLRLLRTVGLADLPEDQVSAGTLSAVVRLGGSVAAPQIDADISGRDLVGTQLSVADARAHVTGQPVGSRLSFSARAEAGIVAEQALVDFQASGQLDGNLLTIDHVSASQAVRTGSLALSGTYDLKTEQYSTSLGVRDWTIVPTEDRPLGAQVSATFQGAGTVSAPFGTGSLHVADASWSGASFGDLLVDLHLDGQAATVNGRAPALNATFEARTKVKAPYDAAADIRVDDLDLERVIPPAATPVRMTGTMSATAHAEGALENWRTGTARVDVPFVDAKAGDLPIRLSEPAHLEYRQQQIRVDRFEALAGATRISASGELPGRGLELAVNGDIGEAAQALAATGLAQLPITQGSGPLLLTARVTGTMETPVLAADLSAGPGVLAIKDLSTASDVTVRAHLEHDVVDLRDAHASYEGAMLNATGSVPLAFFNPAPLPSTATPGSLHATATGITPAVLHGILDPATLEEIGGTVDLALNVESPSMDLSRVSGDLTLTRLDLQMAGLPVTQRTPTRIVARDGFARVESWNWAGQGATLGIFGQVRLVDRQAAIIANGDIDLRVLTPFVRSAGLATAGRLTPKLSVTGPIDAPRIDGDVILDGGEVRLLDPRVVMNGLSARATLSRTTATLTALSGSINGGAVTGTGTVAYLPDAGLSAQLTADVRDMALEFPAGLRSELNAMLQLDATSAPGQSAPSGSLSGTLTVQHGAYREPLAVVGGLLTALRARRAAAAAGDQGSGIGDHAGFLDQLALDVRVQTDDDLIVDNNYARVQLGADLDVIGTAAAPAMSGRATVREDGQLFIGRNVYTIKRDTPSTIDFVSATSIEPELNVNVTTRAGGEDIDLALTGPADAPQVAMSSSSGDSQADITALLLTGRKLDDLSTADASFIGTQVIGNLSGEVLGFAGRAIGLDTLRLGGVQDNGTRQDPNAVASEVDPTSRLTFGKTLGSNVDLTFSQSLRDSTAQTWIVEYMPSRQLVLRVVSGDTDLRSYGFRHDVFFGGGALAATRTPSAGSTTEERISEVSVTGELAFPEPRVRALLKLGAGDKFDFARWQDDRDRLEDFYHQNGRLAAHVAASRATDGEQVKLSYVIDAGPQTTIVVSGIDLGRDELQRLSDAWAASIFDEFLVDEATQAVKGALGARGYLQPMIAARVVSEADTKTLRIEVQTGVHSAETRIQIQSADEALTRDLEARVAERRLVVQVIRDPGAVTRDLTDYLRSRGYLRATVKAVTPAFDNGVTTVPIAIDAGPQFSIASVAFAGPAGVSEYDLTGVAAIATGMPYDPAVIDAARARLVALYRSRGFASAAVESRADIQPGEPRVNVTFAVQEHPRQTIGDVAVSGNGGVDPDVVTRALGLTVGAPLEPTELLRARTRVFNTGLFRRVDVSTEMMNRGGPADASQPMRVRVDVEAWPALRLRYGFQVAEEHPESDPTGRTLAPGLSADLTRRTLFGRAVSLGGVLQYERRQNTARALLSAPTLLALPIQSSLVLERVHEQSEASSFSTDRNSVSWEQRLRPNNHLNMSYSYRFDRDHTFDTSPDIGSGLNFDIRIRVARLIGTTAWDTRNDPLDAMRGTLLSSSLEWAPDRLGSQFRFIKYVGQAYRFQDVHGVVLASAARLGFVRPLGGQELFIGERFFAGGSRTVRGIDEGALGPRDVFGDPAGGEAMLVFNQEARVPIFRWLRGVAFIDAGNVFPQPAAIRLNALTGSIGFGVRVSTPFALIRADYGKVEWIGSTVPPAGASLRPGQWVIGIGQAF